MQHFWEPLRVHRDCSADVESESRINTKPQSQWLTPAVAWPPGAFCAGPRGYRPGVPTRVVTARSQALSLDPWGKQATGQVRQESGLGWRPADRVGPEQAKAAKGGSGWSGTAWECLGWTWEEGKTGQGRPATGPARPGPAYLLVSYTLPQASSRGCHLLHIPGFPTSGPLPRPLPLPGMPSPGSLWPPFRCHVLPEAPLPYTHHYRC